MKHEVIALASLSVIVRFGEGSKVIRIAKEEGASGGTIMLGRGTYHHRLMHLLGLNDSRKEIVWLIARKERADRIMDRLTQEMRMEEANRGVAFATQVRRFLGVRQAILENPEREEPSMYQAIYTIVNKGQGHEVIKAAADAGANGGTIIQGRGSGTHETARVFAVEIEPEKEIVLSLVPVDRCEAIVEAIREKLRIDEPGTGIIFVQDVSRSVGLS